MKNKKRFRTEPINPTRGRKPSKNNKKAIHSKHEYYNILTKIQVHFFRFLIKYTKKDIMGPTIRPNSISY